MKILGINPAHDSSVCVLEDGKVVSFFKEERLSGKKRAATPTLALNAVLEQHKVFDAVVYGSAGSSQESKLHEYAAYISQKAVVGEFVDLSDAHHLQHASLGFYNSGFLEAAVIVIDRNGSIKFNASRESETIYKASYPCTFEEKYKSLWVYNNFAQVAEKDAVKECPDVELDVRSMHGVVKVYETATTLIKQDILENGKTMGLSAYGDKDKTFEPLFVPGTNIPNDYYLSHNQRNGNYEAINAALHQIQSADITKENYQPYADYAWQVQKQTQDAVCVLIEKALEKTGLRNVVITGGYGLNVVANAYFKEKFPDVSFFFEPLADDTGNSIGGAMLYYRDKTKDTTIYPLTDTFFHGVDFVVPDIGVPVELQDVAEKLASQKSVAIFNGKAEAGPRALGNRSILFDARNKDAVAIVNKIKKREWYRPFAAVCLQADAELFFESVDVVNHKFMTLNATATDIGKSTIPGVLHVDGTCRIQVAEAGTPIHALLVKFKELTGVGVLLNTSFNLAGQPLVDHPDTAIATLQESELDYVWFVQSGKLVF